MSGTTDKKGLIHKPRPNNLVFKNDLQPQIIMGSPGTTPMANRRKSSGNLIQQLVALRNTAKSPPISKKSPKRQRVQPSLQREKVKQMRKTQNASGLSLNESKDSLGQTKNDPKLNSLLPYTPLSKMTVVQKTNRAKSQQLIIQGKLHFLSPRNSNAQINIPRSPLVIESINDDDRQNDLSQERTDRSQKIKKELVRILQVPPSSPRRRISDAKFFRSKDDSKFDYSEVEDLGVFWDQLDKKAEGKSQKKSRQSQSRLEDLISGMAVFDDSFSEEYTVEEERRKTEHDTSQDEEFYRRFLEIDKVKFEFERKILSQIHEAQSKFISIASPIHIDPKSPEKKKPFFPSNSNLDNRRGSLVPKKVVKLGHQIRAISKSKDETICSLLRNIKEPEVNLSNAVHSNGINRSGSTILENSTSRVSCDLLKRRESLPVGSPKLDLRNTLIQKIIKKAGLKKN